jgi:hypothetical protein
MTPRASIAVMFLHLLMSLFIAMQTAPQERPSPEAVREAYERQRAEAEGKRIADERAIEIQKQRDAETKSPLTAAQVRELERKRQEVIRQKTSKDLRAAIKGFQSAHQELSEALGFKAKIRPSAEKLEKNTKVFLSFLQNKTKQRGRFDAAEFKDFKDSELAWETLTTAERLTPILAGLIANEEAEAVNIRSILSLPALEQELLRLQWMTRQLK